MMKEYLGLLLVTWGLSVSAQEITPLKLQDALEVALKSNRELVIAKLDEEGNAAKFNQTSAVFLPQINISYTAFTSNNPLNAFGFKLQQQGITQSDFDPSRLNNPSATPNFMAKAELNQPLINLDMIYARNAAREQIHVYSYKTKRTKEYIIYEVQKAYAQLQLAHEAVTVLTEALQTSNSIYTSTNNRFEKGLLQKSDVLQVQVQVAATESKLSEAKSSVKNASDYLSLLMGAKTGIVYSTDSITLANDNQTDEQKIPEGRADFQAMKAAIRAQDLMIQSGKMAYMPKLNAFANYFINDKSAFGFGSNSYLLGAQFSWNVFSGTSAKYKVSEYRVGRSKLEQQFTYQKEQSQLELDKTNRQLNDASFATKQYEAAVSQASEALRILKNRFEQGLITVSDLLQAQSSLSQQKLMRAQAIFQYNTTKSYLQFLTLTSEK
jgi:outer membrane protein TolC